MFKARYLLVLTLAVFGSAHSNEIENENLVRIQREIGYLISVVEQAKEQRTYNGKSPVQFRYDILVERLNILQGDIGKHLTYSNSLPKNQNITTND